MSLQTRFSTATPFHTFYNLIRSCDRVTNTYIYISWKKKKINKVTLFETLAVWNVTKIAETLESAKDKCLLLVCFPPSPTTSLLTSVVAFGQTAQNVNKKIEDCESSLFSKQLYVLFSWNWNGFRLRYYWCPECQKPRWSFGKALPILWTDVSANP